MAFKLKYNTVACSRCGGTGNYSYCSMYGTTCFKCRGNKTYLSKAGATAAAAIDAFKKANFSKRFDLLVPGDRVMLPGNKKPRTVLSVEGFAGGWSESNGVRTPYWNVTFSDPTYKTCGYGAAAETLMVMAVTGENWLKVIDFARTIKKGVAVEEVPDKVKALPAATVAA